MIETGKRNESTCKLGYRYIYLLNSISIPICSFNITIEIKERLFFL